MPIVFSVSAGAAVVAATNFDGRVLSPAHTATTLNWIVNGVQDPGNMAALNVSAAPQTIFDGGDTPNMFAPGINTGNGNTFWTTRVSLTAASGSVVTLTDVTFDSWSINGGQTQNVNRKSDFTFSVIDPSGNPVASVDVIDSLSGTGVGVPMVTAIFETPVPLTASGTYTLGIKGGDFLGANETGNHTALDNLSINGIVGGGVGFVITKIAFDPEANSLSLTWNSTPGTTYAVKYSTDLTNWDSDLDDGVPADDGESTTVEFDLTETDFGDLTKAFFRVEVQTAG